MIDACGGNVTDEIVSSIGDIDGIIKVRVI